MSALFHRLPPWLAILPGLAAGWIFSRGMTVERQANIVASSHSQSSHSRDQPANTPPVGVAATVGPVKLRLEPEKLRLLRQCHLDLELDTAKFKVGRPGVAIDSVFGILRRVLDLTPHEEAALRENFTRSAEALRTYERDHVAAYSATDDKISFQLPPTGKFYEELSTSVTRSQKDILGDERAAMFEAITHTDRFCDVPPNFGGVVEFVANPADRSIRTWLDHEQHRITWIGSSSTDIQEQIFGRYDHLIDAESMRRLLEAALAGE